MSDIVLSVDDLRSSASISICRICHEEEELESCKNLEAPCACSGTVKFAHRECIQRWCDEKGNTVCELCLQKFEPGYTCPPKKIAESINTTTVTIRIAPRSETEEEDLEELRTRNLEGELAAERSASRCRLVALIFTALLLMRHLLDLADGAEDYPFSLFTILIAKAGGVIVPMYVLIRITDAIHFSIKRQYQNPNADSSSDEDDDDEDDEDEERPNEA